MPFNNKTYSPDEIAEFLLVYAGKKGDYISNKKLNKLLYYVEAWHLVFFDRSLFKEDIEAWIHGPVIRSIYLKYKINGWNPIPIPDKKLDEFDFPPELNDLLEQVYLSYGDHSADFLERLVHTEEPWLEARGNKSLEDYSSQPISRETMSKFYKTILEKNGKK